MGFKLHGGGGGMGLRRLRSPPMASVLLALLLLATQSCGSEAARKSRNKVGEGGAQEDIDSGSEEEGSEPEVARLPELRQTALQKPEALPSSALSLAELATQGEVPMRETPIRAAVTQQQPASGVPAGRPVAPLRPMLRRRQHRTASPPRPAKRWLTIYPNIESAMLEVSSAVNGRTFDRSTLMKVLGVFSFFGVFAGVFLGVFCHPGLQRQPEVERSASQQRSAVQRARTALRATRALHHWTARPPTVRATDNQSH